MCARRFGGKYLRDRVLFGVRIIVRHEPDQCAALHGIAPRLFAADRARDHAVLKHPAALALADVQDLADLLTAQRRRERFPKFFAVNHRLPPFPGTDRI